MLHDIFLNTLTWTFFFLGIQTIIIGILYIWDRKDRLSALKQSDWLFPLAGLFICIWLFPEIEKAQWRGGWPFALIGLLIPLLWDALYLFYKLGIHREETMKRLQLKTWQEIIAHENSKKRHPK